VPACFRLFTPLNSRPTNDSANSPDSSPAGLLRLANPIVPAVRRHPQCENQACELLGISGQRPAELKSRW